LFILIIAILFIIVMIASPTCRDQMKNRFCPTAADNEKAGVRDLQSPAIAPQPAVTADQAKPEDTKETGGEFYVVQVKDDLVSISEKKLGDSKKWIDIFNANRDIIKSPTLIFPGQKLKMPQAKNDAK
jgi:nucleoid-associated protein YgaU